MLKRLERGDALVLDGGTGSELHRRGVDLLRERAAAESRTWFVEAWSASANNDAPEVVGQVHADYLRVGADVVLTNTFYSGPSRLGLIDAGDEWKRYLDAAVDVALATRDSVKPDAYVLGAFSPPWMHGFDKAYEGVTNTEFMGKQAFVEEMRAVGERLVERGVDAVLFEYLCAAEDVQSGIEALGDLDAPLFLGIAEAEADGSTRRGGSIQEMEGPLGDERVAGVTLMCTEVEAVTPALRLLREVFEGPVGAYPNNGYGSPKKMSSDPLDLFTNPDPPSTFAHAAEEWLDAGAQLVGGCCGTGPEHIRAIRHTVDTHSTVQRAAAS